jgi:hypothetical protein
VKAGVILPTGGPRDAAEIAREAEAAGWDGFFVWEPVWGWDAWVALSAAAMVTARIRLGTNVLYPDGKGREITPDDVRAMAAYVAERRPESSPFDIVIEGETPGEDPARVSDEVGPLADAGMTWWLEARWNISSPSVVNELRKRIAQGPPRA